jgi:hypothetical protein
MRSKGVKKSGTILCGQSVQSTRDKRFEQLKGSGKQANTRGIAMNVEDCADCE